MHLWLCTFSLAIAGGAALLLPVSIASNEVLTLYPQSYYVQWLNHSLIQGMWSYVFLFSNLSLFAFLPFAYLFTESEGFTGYRKGIMARVYETIIVFCLLAVIVFGMTYVMSSLLDDDHSNIHTLLMCTPLGFVHLFAVVGQFLVKPQFLRDINEEFFVAQLEEGAVQRRLGCASATGKSYLRPPPMATGGFDNNDILGANGLTALQNGALTARLSARLADVRTHRQLLDRQRHTSFLQRNLVYPVAMLVLLALTMLTVLIVIQNSLGLLIGMKALPITQHDFTLGISSLSKLGPLGAALEIVIILYLVATSSAGLYTIPVLSRVRPRVGQTPFTHIVANCALLLVLSSALPLLSRILGITNFDLLGDFGKIRWLGNFKIVLLYNLVFAGAVALVLTNKFTATVRRDLLARLHSFVMTLLSKEPLRHAAWAAAGAPGTTKED
ncbi:Protein Lilipod [Gryllus bimaculatus]|nr:Protein Lilipod [Gryllus bimaculatus]